MKALLLILEVICFLILFYPVIWERHNDRNGETRSEKGKDVFIRGLLMVGTSIVNYLLRDLQLLDLHSLVQLLRGIVKPFVMSFSQFFLAFDHLINWRLGHRGYAAFTYLGKTSALDTNKLWIGLGPWGRFIFKLIVFMSAMIYYF
jgi:hypothetical protein